MIDVKSLFFPDIDECEDDNGGCSHACANTKGNYFCKCPAGHYLGDDKKTCLGEFKTPFFLGVFFFASPPPYQRVV